MVMVKRQRTVKALVTGHELWNGKPCTKLDIEEWESSYPFPLYNIKPEHQDLLPVGQTLMVTLEFQSQKKGTDGDKPWHYFLGFVSVAGPEPYDVGFLGEPEPEPEPVDDLFPERAPPPGTGYRDTQADIRRAVALKAAVEYESSDPGGKREDVADTFAFFLALLEGSHG